MGKSSGWTLGEQVMEEVEEEERGICHKTCSVGGHADCDASVSVER